MLAPPVFMGNAFNPAFALAPYADEIKEFLHEELGKCHNFCSLYVLTFCPFSGIYELFPHHDIFSTIGHEVCDDEHPVTENFCVDVFSLLMPHELVNASMISFYLDHLPGGSTSEMFIHFAQNFLNPGEFNKYDFGEEGNLEHYGQSKAPAYDLTQACTVLFMQTSKNETKCFFQVTALTALFVGDMDGLATVADNDILASILPNLHSYEVVDYHGYTHIAFPFATNAGELIHTKIVQYMDELL